jgi:hypothetical protein
MGLLIIAAGERLWLNPIEGSRVRGAPSIVTYIAVL